MNSRILLPAIVPALLAACGIPANHVDLYGDPAPPAAAQRTIMIGPNTKHVNVEGGEVIRFVAGDKEFGWNFFVARSVSSFSLNEVAPVGMLDHEVRAYVSPDPRYIGGGGEKN